MPLVPAGPPVRPLVHGPAGRAGRPARVAAELMAVQFDKLAVAAEGCDALVASGLLPAAASAPVGDREARHPLRLRGLLSDLSAVAAAPSTPFPGRPFPPDVTDNRVLWDLQRPES